MKAVITPWRQDRALQCFIHNGCSKSVFLKFKMSHVILWKQLEYRVASKYAKFCYFPVSHACPLQTLSDSQQPLLHLSDRAFSHTRPLVSPRTASLLDSQKQTAFSDLSFSCRSSQAIAQLRPYPRAPAQPGLLRLFLPCPPASILAR